MFWKKKVKDNSIVDTEPQRKVVRKIINLQVLYKNSANITEEEKQREVDKFFAKESVRRVNWQGTHKNSSDR